MSDDGTREILHRIAVAIPCLRIVDNPQGTTSSGLNAAIRAARGSIIVRMDAHTEYAPDYVRECVRVLEEKKVDNVGGPARTKHEGTVQAAVCAAYHSAFGFGGALFHNVNYEGYVDTVTYGCWRREVFDRIGLFDEELVRNQDDEFNLRLIRAGGKIWQSPRIKSWYRPRAALRPLFKQYLQYGYWKVRIVQKHKRPACLRHIVPGLFVFLLIALPVLALFWTPAISLWLGFLGSYLIANIVASIIAAAKNGWELFPLLPLIFAGVQVGYGAGFLRGIWDFIILRRKPAPVFSRLTRVRSEELQVHVKKNPVT